VGNLLAEGTPSDVALLEKGEHVADERLRATVALFDDPDAAETALEKAQDVGVVEGILINRDAEGKIHQHLANLPDVGPAAAVGAGIGAVGGAVLAAIFPMSLLGVGLAAALAGAAGGSIIGSGAVALKDEIVERRAFHDVAEQLQPGQFALVVLMKPDDALAFDPNEFGATRVWTEDLRGESSSDEEPV
jgi:uncharacterized membrane protein